MKKLFISLTLTASVLLAATGFAGLQNCERPADDNWDNFCSCFLNQAMTACDTCSATTCRPKTQQGVEYNIMCRVHTDADMERACGQQVDANVDNSCLAPGVDQASCVDNIQTFRAHCAKDITC